MTFMLLSIKHWVLVPCQAASCILRSLIHLLLIVLQWEVFVNGGLSNRPRLVEIKPKTVCFARFLLVGAFGSLEE